MTEENGTRGSFRFTYSEQIEKDIGANSYKKSKQYSARWRVMLTGPRIVD